MQLKILWLIFATFGAAIWGGCQATRPKGDLPDISSIKINANASRIPAIDIHTHTFDARDLPIKKIAVGRRDSWLLWWVPDSWAKQLAALIVSKTPSEHAAPDEMTELATNLAEMNLNASPPAVEKLRKSSRNSVVTRAIVDRKQEIELKKHGQQVEKKKVRLSLGERLTLYTIVGFTKALPAGIFTHADTLYEEGKVFLNDLTLSDADLDKQFHVENSSNIEFRVSHMMDLAPTYGQAEDKPQRQLIPFTNQIVAMDAMQHRDPAEMTYFVAYNPYRDNENAGESLEIIKAALTAHHAYGIKVYPPSGYQPLANKIPRRPGTWWHKDPAKEWDSRYTEDGHKITGQVLDRRLMETLSWCATNKIPVFVHCMDSEMQARSGYGVMADARYWRRLLDSHSSLTNLYLCLAHAGGEEWWYGECTSHPWGKDVYYLCTHYPNVYCEFGDLDGVFQTNNQSRFALNIRKLCADNPGFARKIMYGSDWFMPMPQNRQRFFEAFQQVFLWDEMPRDYYRWFFFENALNYLDARERINDVRFPIDSYVRTTLVRLLAQVDKGP